MFEFHHVFQEITVILLLAAAIGAIGTRLKQPLIVSFIAVGILVGPSAMGIIRSHEEVKLLAEIGIAVLLFIVGLKLDLHMIRTMGPVALATGLGQVVFTSVFGFLIAAAMGMSLVPAIYVAVALTYSSTIIIVKLLSDKREIDSLHGRIAIGFLIVQDIMVILSMIALKAIGAGSGVGVSFAGEMARVAVNGAGFLLAVGLLMRYVLPGLLGALARSQELLILFSVAWAVTLATVGDSLGFSKEVGAFLAGISLASSPYRDSIGTRMVTLRDFLLLFFFIHLGAGLDLSTLGAKVPMALVFSVFVLVGNPLIVMIIMGLMGYRKRTSFLAGLTVAQISEFSLILGALGVELGHLDQQDMGLITLVGLITIALSTYMILYSGPLYRILSPYLDIFERKNPHAESKEIVEKSTAADVIIFGLGNYGGNIARNLLKRHRRVMGVDFDPAVLEYWKGQNMPVIYGDAEDPELMDHLPVRHAAWALCVLPDRNANLALFRMLRNSSFEGRIVAAARHQADADLYESAGADLVLRPFVDAAEAAVDSLTAAMHALPQKLAWPASLSEVRLKSGSMFTGKSIGQIPLRAETGVSILAVTRAGKSIFNPGPEFQLYPGDHLVLLGDEENLKKAAEYLEQRDMAIGEEKMTQSFSIGQVTIRPDSPWVGQTLMNLNLRRDHGLTVIGIERDGRQMNAPSAQETLRGNDRLILAGSRAALDRLLVVSAETLDAESGTAR